MSELKPYFQDEFVTLYVGDVRDVVKHLPKGIAQASISSPPFFGLRDYQTASWEGGNAECDHLPPNDAPNGNKGQPVVHAERHLGACRKCGAKRIDSQIGLEPTPADFINALVSVYDGVRSVLREDGTAFLNLGDSYSTGVGANLTDCINSLAKNRPLWFGNPITIRVSPKSLDISLPDDGFPYHKLVRLLGIERITIKQGNNDFHQILNPFTTPIDLWVAAPLKDFLANIADLEISFNTTDDLSIVIAESDADAKPEFFIPSLCSLSMHNSETTFAIEEASKPVAETVWNVQANRDAVSSDSIFKGGPNIDLMKMAVPFEHCFSSNAEPRCDFRITKAEPQQVRFSSKDGRINLSTSFIAHLFVPNKFGSLIRYQELYTKASELSNTLQAKQQLGTPDLVKRALMEKGWICRQSFPYIKSSAMPESVTDRAGNALEYWFHLAVAKDYFSDMDAVRVGMARSSIDRLSQDVESQDGSSRANGGAKTNGKMKAVGNFPPNWKGSSFNSHKTAQHQLNRSQKDRDRSLPTNRNGITGSLDETPAGSRNFRNTDLWFQSVHKPYGLVGVGDEIIGLQCNPKGFTGEFCTACRSYYHDKRDKAQIVHTCDTCEHPPHKENQCSGCECESSKDLRWCVCGRSDAWLSHFATFSIDLITPLIKMSTSEKGQCCECGAAWERVKETELKPTGKAAYNSVADSRDFHADGNDQGSNRMKDGHKPGWFNDVTTLGWQPTCKCDAGDPIPQIIFDPFVGSGTTLIAARKLGRRAIGVELNSDYAEMSVARYKREMKDATAVRPVREEYHDLPLFAVADQEVPA